MWNKQLPLRAEISSPLGLLLGPAQSGKQWTHQDVWQKLMDAPCSCHHVQHFLARLVNQMNHPPTSANCFVSLQGPVAKAPTPRFFNRGVSSGRGATTFHRAPMKGIGMLNWHLDVTIACPKTKVLRSLAEDSYHLTVQFMFTWNLDETY